MRRRMPTFLPSIDVFWCHAKQPLTMPAPEDINRARIAKSVDEAADSLEKTLRAQTHSVCDPGEQRSAIVGGVAGILDTHTFGGNPYQRLERDSDHSDTRRKIVVRGIPAQFKVCGDLAPLPGKEEVDRLSKEGLDVFHIDITVPQGRAERVVGWLAVG